MNNFDSKVLDVEGVKEKFGVRPSQIFDYLCLVGDTSDNIPGVPKVGPKTAVTLLEQYNDLDNIIENSSQLKGKLKENIESSLETIELAKKLVALKDNLKLLILLSDSGSVRSILPLINISTSSSAFTQTLTF